jgi:type 1 glutamine amidotransferase
MLRKLIAGLAAVFAMVAVPAAAQTVKPIRVLIVSGGGYHNYANQRAILEQGLKARLNVEITHSYYDMSPGEDQTKPKLPIFTNPNYGDGFDVVIHNECGAGVDDQAIVQTVLAPHIKGVPGVNLHCAMHSYRAGTWQQRVADGAPNGKWFEYLGIQSTGHGPQFPIVLKTVDAQNAVVKGLPEWTTPKEELYNNVRVFEGVTPLISGQQPDNPDARAAGQVLTVAWTHLYGPANTRVFSTTLAHNENTMNDARYLDLVARGVLWATGHLGADGKAAPGYGK